ncbi:MAG: hypothetical protein KKD29_05300 [Candidatus Omnitrophica bacterium]|nr:hypothetical protein [Candidatus Omnitrophota bacterium]MBU4488154.1 hypothetical protein [Candidatus Omnitrophota bacterium]MCG2704541.1 hypothetical protein [Candidatus Omnitrophota bacterium]
MTEKNKIIIIAVLFFLFFPKQAFGSEAVPQDSNKGYIQKNDTVEGMATRTPIDVTLPKISIHGPKEWIPIVDLTAYGTYSHADKGDDVWGASVFGTMAPAMKYNDDLYIIPLYSGSYQREKFFVVEEEGPLSTTEIQHHDLSMTAKYLLTEKVTISPTIFGGWDLNVESKDEGWGNGLYDYREMGSGSDFDYLVYDTSKGRIQLTSGAKWYIRQYPNYHSLISLATPTAPEVHEKDYNGIELSSGWKYTNLKNTSLDLKYILLMKYFIDKKVVDEDGILEGRRRQEYRNSIKLSALYSPAPNKGFQYNYSSEFTCNTGNQNFYDSRGTAVLSDDVFTPRYYDYLGFDARPEISYIFVHKDKPVAILSGGYNFLMRNYTSRKPQDADGGYKSGKQIDFEHIFKASMEIPVTKHVSWVTRYDYTLESSNMDYEQFYTYNYKLHRVMSGMSISY